MLTNLFRRRAPVSDGVAASGDAALMSAADAHLAYQHILCDARTREGTWTRFYGVSVRVRDCAGGDHIDLIEEHDGARFYRCQVCEGLLIVQVTGEVLDLLDAPGRPRRPGGAADATP